MSHSEVPGKNPRDGVLPSVEWKYVRVFGGARGTAFKTEDVCFYGALLHGQVMPVFSKGIPSKSHLPGVGSGRNHDSGVQLYVSDVQAQCVCAHTRRDPDAYVNFREVAGTPELHACSRTGFFNSSFMPLFLSDAYCTSTGDWVQRDQRQNISKSSTSGKC